MLSCSRLLYCFRCDTLYKNVYVLFYCRWRALDEMNWLAAAAARTQKWDDNYENWIKQKKREYNQLHQPTYNNVNVCGKWMKCAHLRLLYFLIELFRFFFRIVFQSNSFSICWNLIVNRFVCFSFGFFFFVCVCVCIIIVVAVDCQSPSFVFA